MISSLSFSTIAHATEDPDRVKSAILNLIPKDIRTSITINQTSAKGHHGNPITLLTVEVNDPDFARSIFDHIKRSLSEAELSMIRDQIDLYYDGRSSIFLRFDKQSAYLGSLRTSLSDDVIKVRINLKRATPSSVSKLFSP
ncbi:MAG: RNA-binding domain-containing protein [Candidatus Methanomethylicaceae archaeon]